jgi:eukaryotic-like serine/threonine-protein kinase
MKIGQFEVLSTLGSGGSGIVYKARNEVLGRVIALKQLNRPVKEGDRVFERFRREAQLMAAIESDHVVRLYSYCAVDGRPLLEMEYLDGGSLEDVMCRGPIAVGDTLAIVRDVLRGLVALHDAGIVHRDVKPANVLRDRAGRHKLTDFGVSVVESEIKTTFEAATIRWVAPESVAQPPTLDSRSDLYAVGMIAYEAILGVDGFREAFPDLTPVAAFGEKWLAWLKDSSKAATPLHVLRASVPVPVSLFVARLMSKDPERRFESAEAALDSLEIVAAAVPGRPAQPAEAEPRRERAYAASRQASSPAPGAEAAAAPTQAPPAGARRLPPALRYAAVAFGSLVVAIGAVLLGAAVRPPKGRVVEPAQVAARPASATQQTDAPAAAPRLVARVTDEQGGALSEVEVKLRPGDVTAQPTGGGEYVIEGLSPQIYELTASKPGYGVIVKQIAIKGGALREDVVLRASTVAAETPSAKPADVIVATPPAPAPPRTPAVPPPSDPCASRGARARDLFYCAGAEPAKAAYRAAPQMSGSAGLRYRIQRLDGERPADVDAGVTFHSGDRVRFAFESNLDGYLYVVQEGSSGRWTVLFPSPQINSGRNVVRAFEPHFVPTGNWFTFDDNPGVERIFVFLSKVPMPDLPGFSKPVTRVETLAQAQIDELARSIRSRDLVLDSTPAASPSAGGDGPVSGTFVVNRNELASAVTATFELVHR